MEFQITQVQVEKDYFSGLSTVHVFGTNENGEVKVEQAWLLPWHRLESSHSPNWPPPAPTVKLLSPEWRLPLKPEYIKSNI